MRFFNKLERRFGRYAIHNLMYYIIIMYVMGFVMMYMDPMFFTRYLSLDAEAILHGQVWRLVTFLLYPPTLSPFWIIFAALMYYSLGRSLEAVWGAFRFNVFFFMGAIGIILAEFIVYFIWGWDMHLNTSYLSMSIFLAYAFIFTLYLPSRPNGWRCLMPFSWCSGSYTAAYPSESPFSCPLPTSSFSS